MPYMLRDTLGCCDPRESTLAMETAPFQLSAYEAAHRIASGRLSSEELVSGCLEAIRARESTIQAWAYLDEAAALRQARERDASPVRGPLHGVPVAVKDIIHTADMPTGFGAAVFANHQPQANASCVQQLQDAGAVIIGKTVTTEFAYFTPGPTTNPHNRAHTPGGSSSGSAAAVAARLAPAATGTDTGGSIRQPAAFCGITGFKPSYGRVSRWGMIAFASSLDQGGPMTKTAEDAAIMLNVMAGHDSKDSTSSPTPAADYTETLGKSIEGLKIGLPKEYFDERLDPTMASTVQDALKELEKLGATFVDIELPSSALSVPAYYVIAPAEASSNLSRFDGVRYGYRCENPTDLQDLYTRTRSEGFGEEVKRRILVGTYALSAGYYDAYYRKAQQIRRLIQQDFVKAFEQVDVIAGPTSPSPAFRFGEKTNDPVAMYLEDIYTIAVNLAGLPALSVPAGMINNMPVGLQLVGNYFAEQSLLNVAHQFQQATDWHQQTPAIAQ